MVAISTVDVILTGLFGLAGTYLTYRWGRTQKIRADAEAEENRLQKERDLFTYQVTRPLVELPLWATICSKIDRYIMDPKNNTRRVLIFICVNGRDDPKTTTAVWQFRNMSSHQSYIDVDLTKEADRGDYVQRLNETRRAGRIHFAFADIPNCIIGDVGRQEGLGETCWYWVGSIPSAKTKQVGGVYVSGATLEGDEMPEREVIELQNLVWEMFEPFSQAYSKYGYTMEH